MTWDLAWRALVLAVVLAGAETLHGIARNLLLVPRVGPARALRVGIVAGSLLAFGICLVLVPWVGPTTHAGQVALGAWLALFMAGFDLALGRLMLRRPWRAVLADFNPASGNLLLYGLLALALMPTLVVLLRADGAGVR